LKLLEAVPWEETECHLSSNDYYAMGWEVQHYQDVEVIAHNGAVAGYTTGMFLVPGQKLAIALVMNTYSPMLGIRAARIPGSVLRMLLGQEIIPGTEFVYKQLIYAGVMLMPLLLLGDIVVTFRRKKYRRRRPRLTVKQGLGLVAAPLLWNSAIAILLLVLLPTAFGVSMPVVILFQPDVGWVALISGITAILWGLLKSGLFLRGAKMA
jgi:hypothetical protein